MAQFTAEVFQNEFLPDGGTEVHAIVTITCEGAGTAGSSGDAAVVLVVDTSGSMIGHKMDAARYAASVAVDQILDGTYFAIVAGTDGAMRAFPYPNAVVDMVRMEPGARAAAKHAISLLQAGGGTAIGSWLRLSKRLLDTVPSASQRRVLLLTDGRNQSETPEALASSIALCQEYLQCDCRGIGSDWDVAELRKISTALLGTVDLIPGPDQLVPALEQLMRQAMSRGVPDATLQVWTPKGATTEFVRQVAPTVEELTGRRREVNALTGAYPTGAWSDESRDYHIGIRLGAKPVGAEQLAARVQLHVGDDVVANVMVKAVWSDDADLTTQINSEVAHYTDQTELAEAIQEGLAAKSAGRQDEATAKLGRAVQLAVSTGNSEATRLLSKVVEIEDAGTGTVRIRRDVDRLDEMALDTSSTKTTRVRQ